MSGTREYSFEVKWRIENIKSWFQTRTDTFYSPQFLAEMLSNTRWKLRLSTQWHLGEKYICLALQRDVRDEGPEEIRLNCELQFVSHDGSPLQSKLCAMKFASTTVSRELMEKDVKMFVDEKEDYLPEGVLTIRCKLCKVWSTVARKVKCSLRSVVGTKCITLDSFIDNFRNLSFPSNVNVKFMSPSSEISFISFNVLLENEYKKMKFERIELKCKCFLTYSCKLFALDDSGRQVDLDVNLSTLLSSDKLCECESIYSWFNIIPKCLRNNTLKLKLNLTYSPSVELECIEYEPKKCEGLSCDDKSVKGLKETANLENLNSVSDDQHMAQHEEKRNDTAIEQSRYQDDSSRNGNALSTTLKNDLTSLHDDRLFCDTKLQSDTETFLAHRCVLSARSPVFKKMFTTDMKEKAGECINVPDIISSDTVRRMLQFLYTDYTGDLDMQSAKDLYIASDKYDIISLKERCSFFTMQNLSPANVCEILVLADMHQDKDLESAAQEYVLANDEEVFYSDEWKLFMKNYSGLAAQVMYLKCTKK